jgi:hypothetical protein
MIRVPFAVAVVSAIAAGSVFASPPSSASYELERLTVNAAAVSAASASFSLRGSLGQESVVGAASSDQFALQTAFWSFAGSGLVPVVLSLGKNHVNPNWPDLLWSGNSAPYRLYRATNCADVFADLLTTQSARAYTDSSPPATRLICYNVLEQTPAALPAGAAKKPAKLQAATASPVIP